MWLLQLCLLNFLCSTNVQRSSKMKWFRQNDNLLLVTISLDFAAFDAEYFVSLHIFILIDFVFYSM